MSSARPQRSLAERYRDQCVCRSESGRMQTAGWNSAAGALHTGCPDRSGAKRTAARLPICGLHEPGPWVPAKVSHASEVLSQRVHWFSRANDPF